MIKQLIKKVAKHTLLYWAYTKMRRCRSQKKKELQQRQKAAENISTTPKTQELFEYAIDGFLLHLNAEHKLPEYQSNFAMYDRFVPYLGKLANSRQNMGGGVIIDIGANVGDTTAALIRHTDSDVICVEPTNKFFALLQRNVESFGEPYKSRIKLVNAYIGRNESDQYVSKITNGTAVKVKMTSGNAEAPTYSIPTMLKNLNIKSDALALVKVDTDGFDAECIMSMGNMLKDISPFLYWENEIDVASQTVQYKEMADYLERNGYTHYFVFDNFGNYLCCTDKTGYKSVCAYLLRILKGTSARTFYYVDVLASKDDGVAYCDSVICQYLAQFNDAL